MSTIGFLDIFKSKDKPVTLDLPPEPPKLHEVMGHQSASDIDGELLPRHLKPQDYHELPPLPDLDDDLLDLEPLSFEDHGLKSDDDLNLNDLPSLPSPEGKHSSLPPMPKPPAYHPAPPIHHPAPPIHHPAPPIHHPAPPIHHPAPPIHHPASTHPPHPPSHHRAPEHHFPKPPMMPSLPSPVVDGPSFGDFFPGDSASLVDPLHEDKIIRDDAAFLSVSSFERVLEDMQTSREDLKRIHHYVLDISGYVGEEDKAYSSFREDIIDIQRRLARMDKVLFADN
ncbi:MAG: hypothetical protein O2779_02465 [Nanoarchaeota archaeon]|nr:hypothetical protein [Nanoarchaeota archaeon]